MKNVNSRFATEEPIQVKKDKKGKENRIMRELFLTFALKRHPPTKFDRSGSVVASSEYSEETILKELKRFAAHDKIFLDEKSSRHITTTISNRLINFFERKDSKPLYMRACCCFDARKTCKRKNAWSRTKLLGATAMAYLDTVSDVFIFVAILNLVGTVESRQFWIIWSVFCILTQSFLHSYYISNCQGWRERTGKEKFKSIVINLCFLRPFIELIKSCQVSIDLEDPHIEDWKDDVRLAMNGKFVYIRFDSPSTSN